MKSYGSLGGKVNKAYIREAFGKWRSAFLSLIVGAFLRKKLQNCEKAVLERFAVQMQEASVCYREQRKWEQLKKQRLVAEPVLSCSPQRHNSRGGC